VGVLPEGSLPGDGRPGRRPRLPGPDLAALPRRPDRAAPDGPPGRQRPARAQGRVGRDRRGGEEARHAGRVHRLSRRGARLRQEAEPGEGLRGGPALPRPVSEGREGRGELSATGLIATGRRRALSELDDAEPPELPAARLGRDPGRELHVLAGRRHRVHLRQLVVEPDAGLEARAQEVAALLDRRQRLGERRRDAALRAEIARPAVPAGRGVADLEAELVDAVPELRDLGGLHAAQARARVDVADPGGRGELLAFEVERQALEEPANDAGERLEVERRVVVQKRQADVVRDRREVALQMAKLRAAPRLRVFLPIDVEVLQARGLRDLPDVAQPVSLAEVQAQRQALVETLRETADPALEVGAFVAPGGGQARGQTDEERLARGAAGGAVFESGERQDDVERDRLPVRRGALPGLERDPAERFDAARKSLAPEQADPDREPFRTGTEEG